MIWKNYVGSLGKSPTCRDPDGIFSGIRGTVHGSRSNFHCILNMFHNADYDQVSIAVPVRMQITNVDAIPVKDDVDSQVEFPLPKTKKDVSSLLAGAVINMPLSYIAGALRTQTSILPATENERTMPYKFTRVRKSKNAFNLCDLSCMTGSKYNLKGVPLAEVVNHVSRAHMRMPFVAIAPESPEVIEKELDSGSTSNSNQIKPLLPTSRPARANLGRTEAAAYDSSTDSKSISNCGSEAEIEAHINNGSLCNRDAINSDMGNQEDLLMNESEEPGTIFNCRRHGLQVHNQDNVPDEVLHDDLPPAIDERVWDESVYSSIPDHPKVKVVGSRPGEQLTKVTPGLVTPFMVFMNLFPPSLFKHIAKSSQEKELLLLRLLKKFPPHELTMVGQTLEERIKNIDRGTLSSSLIE